MLLLLLLRRLCLAPARWALLRLLAPVPWLPLQVLFLLDPRSPTRRPLQKPLRATKVHDALCRLPQGGLVPLDTRSSDGPHQQWQPQQQQKLRIRSRSTNRLRGANTDTAAP